MTDRRIWRRKNVELTMGKNIKWQSVHVKFPKKLYLYATWTKNDSLMPYFMSLLHKSLKSLVKDAEKRVKYYTEYKQDFEHVLNAILVLSLSYDKDYPLKKSLWKVDPEVKYDHYERLLHLIHATEKPDLYNMCVTPYYDQEKDKQPVLRFGAAFPYLKSQESEIDTIMKSSDFHVTPKAKNCAIYKFDRVYGYDLKTGEIVDRRVKETELLN